MIRTSAAAMGVAARRAYLARHPNPPDGWVLDASDDLYAPATSGDLRVAITLEDGGEFEEAYRAFIREVGPPPEGGHQGPQYRVSVSRPDREPDSSDLRDVALAFFPDQQQIEAVVMRQMSTPPRPGMRRVVSFTVAVR